MEISLSRTLVTIINVEMITTMILSAGIALVFAVYVGSYVVQAIMEKRWNKLK